MLVYLCMDAALGLIVGMRCRVGALIGASACIALIAAATLLASGHDGLSAILHSAGFLAVLQAWFLVGALVRISGRSALENEADGPLQVSLAQRFGRR